MAVRGQLQIVRGIAASKDLSSYKYHFVELESGKLDVCDALGTDQAIGVLQDKPDADGVLGEVVMFGFTKVVAAEAISTVGTLITSDASGHAISLIPGTNTTYYILGRTLSVSTGAGDIIEVAINCINPARAA